MKDFNNDEEYKQLISLLESTLDLDAKGRVRAVTLLPLPVAVALTKAAGRSALTTAFLTALSGFLAAGEMRLVTTAMSDAVLACFPRGSLVRLALWAAPRRCHLPY